MRVAMLLFLPVSQWKEFIFMLPRNGFVRRSGARILRSRTQSYNEMNESTTTKLGESYPIVYFF